MSTKRLAVCLVLFAAASAAAPNASAQGDPGGKLTTISALKNVSNAEAERHNSVAFEGTVTFFHPSQQSLFVQDGDAAIYVSTNTTLKLVPGDRVLVRGEMRPSFRPLVASSNIARLGHGPLPESIQADFGQMIHSQVDCRLVTVQGSVRAADWIAATKSDPPYAILHLIVKGEHLDALSANTTENEVSGLTGAEVKITGVAGAQFDNKLQQTGEEIFLQSLADLKILRSEKVDPLSMPVTPMDRIIEGRKIDDLSRLVRVHGTVTFYEPGHSAVLQDGQKSVRVILGSSPDVRVGDVADAFGYPDVQEGFLTLTQAELRDSQIVAAVTPTLCRWKDLSVPGTDGVNHMFELVSIDGQVITEARQATQDEYVLQSEGHLFSAILRHSESASQAQLEPMGRVPVGSRIRVTGVSILADANHVVGEVPFNILMRSSDDVQILERPSWLNVTNLLYLVAILLVSIVVVGARGWYIEHRSRRKTSALAQIEQRRSRILENMNASKPLAETLEQITMLTSFKLQGLPCWCEIAGGGTVGNRPDKVHDPSWNVIEAAIPSNSGIPFGSFFVAQVGHTPTAREIEAAMTPSAGLAALAIETSRLHMDLVHRSEFDQLTEIRNRFSLEQKLDRMIDLAPHAAGMFGLIYIDLNEFKQVNDHYGHLAGDIYLQEVAARMKRQLRPGDTLARLGGDEFAVLVPEVRNRAAVMEVATRLEGCFEAAFKLGGPIIAGSASIGIALFPEDGTTKDCLLNVADAAMYKAKKTRRRAFEMRMEPQRSSA